MFVHISAVERAGLSTLNEGQTVQYEIVSNRGKEFSRKPKSRLTAQQFGTAGARRSREPPPSPANEASDAVADFRILQGSQPSTKST